VSGFAFLECFALTEDTVGFLGVWIGMWAVGAVSSVQRLRMSANANFIVDHVTPVPRVCGQGQRCNRVFYLDNFTLQLEY
jgi:hypothetical protein